MRNIAVVGLALILMTWGAIGAAAPLDAPTTGGLSAEEVARRAGINTIYFFGMSHQNVSYNSPQDDTGRFPSVKVFNGRQKILLRSPADCRRGCIHAHEI